jgi:hypothetical protein
MSVLTAQISVAVLRRPLRQFQRLLWTLLRPNCTQETTRLSGTIRYMRQWFTVTAQFVVSHDGSTSKLGEFLSPIQKFKD